MWTRTAPRSPPGGCGVCYMLSGYHGLYSSQTFVTEKWASEYHEKK